MNQNERRAGALVALLAGSGLLHFAVPRPYRKIVPPVVGDPKRVVQLSGVAELLCALLLSVPATRRLGGRLSATLFVAVFPANIYAVKVAGPRRSMRALAVARLPLQLPMVTAALAVARDGTDSAS